MYNKKSRLIILTIVSFLLMFSLSLVASEAPALTQQTKIKHKKITPQTPDFKKLIIFQGWATEINCTDGYIIILTEKCKNVKINVESSKCNSLNLQYADRVYGSGKKASDGSITASTIKKSSKQYLIGKITELNCIDRYVRISVCNGKIEAKVLTPRELCNEFEYGDKVKVRGVFSYSSSTGLLIKNPTMTKL